MTEINPDVFTIMACCAFDTIEQMNGAYEVGSVALNSYRIRIIEEAAKVAYEAVDAHLWDASVAEKVRDQIRATRNEE